MAVGRTGRAVARFFERISRLLQPFANRPFGGLSPMLDGLAGSVAACSTVLPVFFAAFSTVLPVFSTGP